MKPMQAMMPATNPSMKLRTPGLIFPSPRAPFDSGRARHRKLVDMDTFSLSTRERRAYVLGLTLIALGATACTPLRRAPGEPLRRVTTVPALTDDGTRSALVTAVQESTRYFTRLPPDRVLAFGATTRTAA